MARKYDLVTIDDVVYELHAVKSDGKKLGLVPVRYFTDDTIFMDWVRSLPDGEIELLHADWKYGNAVRLQRMARELATGEKFTDVIRDKIANRMTSEELGQYAGKFDALNAECKRIWESEKDSLETVEDYVFEELI